MDGKPLYEYARESKPLPRAIPSRQCTVSIDLLDFTPASVASADGRQHDGGHEYRWPTKQLTEEEKSVFHRLTKMVQEAQSDVEAVPVPDLEAAAPEVSAVTGVRPATFTIRMTVSSGTYVRSIVHDIGLALGCGAHVVKLTRTRQGEFSLYGDEEKIAQLEGKEAEAGPSGGCVPWSVWQKAIDERKEMIEKDNLEKEEMIASGASAEELDQQFSTQAIFEKRRAGGLKEWETEVLRRFVSVPVP